MLVEERGKVDAQLKAERLQQEVRELQKRMEQQQAQLERLPGVEADERVANASGGADASNVGDGSSSDEAGMGGQRSTEGDLEMAR